MRRINVSLFIGAAILLFFLSMCFYPEHFSDADPYGRERLQYSNDNGKGTIIVPPIPPNEEYPFGTDHRGRDVKSLIVYGSRLTIFSALSIAAIRLMIALPLSIAAAYKVRFANNFISFFNTMFSAFPLIIVIADQFISRDIQKHQLYKYGFAFGAGLEQVSSYAQGEDR